MPFDFDARAGALPPQVKDKQPTRSIDIVVFEAKKAQTGAAQRREELAKVKTFQVSDLDDIPAAVEELQKAQAGVMTARKELREESLAPVRLEADKLLTDGMRAAKYLFRKDPAALDELSVIGDIGPMHDRVGDLYRFADWCNGREEHLKADPKLPTDIAKKARELADKLTGAPDSSASKAALQRRNVAYWVVVDMTNEVRAAVKFRYPDDEAFVERVCGRVETSKPKTPEKPAETPETTPV